MWVCVYVCVIWAHTADAPTALLFFHSNVELVHESAKGSVWLNGTEVTHEDKKSAVLADNSVLEICGLKFAVELSAR